MAYEIRVERARCIATKACVSAAPATFALDPTMVAAVVDPEGDSKADVVDAAQGCPTGAISVWEDGTRIA